MEIYDKKEFFWHNIYSVIFIVMVILAMVVLGASGRLPDGISSFDFLIVILATFRLIRLFVYDSITANLRRYLATYEYGPGKELSNLINCPWCAGIWLAFFVSFLYFLSGFWWYPLFILALAGAATFVQIAINKIGKKI